MKIQVKNARLSFPDLFTARAFQAGHEPKFKATFLIPKDSPQCKEIEAAIKKVATDKWGAKAESILKGIRNNPNKFCFQDGDSKDYDGYAGMMSVSASSKSRPTVVNTDRSPLTEADGKPYAGCFVNGIITFFAYENSGNGISASLNGVQFVKDGDAFGGGRAASADEFDALEAAEAEDFA